MNRMEIREILNYLPHRFPFLLIDRVLSCEPGKTIVAIKNVTINEPYFQGHFPGNPVMPGVMILESLAQAAAILSFLVSSYIVVFNFPNPIARAIPGISNAMLKLRHANNNVRELFWCMHHLFYPQALKYAFKT